MTEPRIDISDDQLWEYCRIRFPQEFASTWAEQNHIHLSYLPGRESIRGVDLDDVQADLGAGLVMTERTGTDGPYYLLTGSRYTVFINPSIARDGAHAMADVTSIKQRSLPTTDTVRPASVRFYHRREEAYCDPALLLPAMAEARNVVRSRRVRHKQLVKEIRNPAAPPAMPMADLRRVADRSYAPLRMMLDLIALRSRLEGGIVADGTVLNSRPDELYVRWPAPRRSSPRPARSTSTRATSRCIPTSRASKNSTTTSCSA